GHLSQSAIKLAGFALAHAAWSISEGKPLCALIFSEDCAGRRLHFFESDPASDHVVRCEPDSASTSGGYFAPDPAPSSFISSEPGSASAALGVRRQKLRGREIGSSGIYVEIPEMAEFVEKENIFLSCTSYELTGAPEIFLPCWAQVFNGSANVQDR